MCLFVFVLFSILKNMQKKATVDTVFCPDLVSRLRSGIQIHIPFNPIYGFEVICNYLFYIFVCYILVSRVVHIN